MNVKIKQTPDSSAESIGLDKYGKSVLPGCRQAFQPTTNKNGRWITGLDEEALDINRISDPTLRESRKKEIRELREDLERRTGFNLSANPSNAFWDTYWVILSGEEEWNLESAEERIKYEVGIANRNIAPDLDTAQEPEFARCKFYAFREEEDLINKNAFKELKNSAFAELQKIKSKKNFMFLIAVNLLGTKVKESMKVETIYNQLDDYLMNDYKGLNYRNFLALTARKTEDLQAEYYVRLAVAKSIIRLQNGTYSFSGKELGKTVQDATKYLMEPNNSADFAFIIQQLDDK